MRVKHFSGRNKIGGGAQKKFVGDTAPECPLPWLRVCSQLLQMKIFQCVEGILALFKKTLKNKIEDAYSCFKR